MTCLLLAFMEHLVNVGLFSAASFGQQTLQSACMLNFNYINCWQKKKLLYLNY